MHACTHTHTHTHAHTHTNIHTHTHTQRTPHVDSRGRGNCERGWRFKNVFKHMTFEGSFQNGRKIKSARAFEAKNKKMYTNSWTSVRRSSFNPMFL